MSAFRQSLQVALAGVQGPLPASLSALAEEWGNLESPAQALFQVTTLLTQAERCARLLPRSSATPVPVAEAETETLRASEGALPALLAQGMDAPNPFVIRDKAELLIARSEYLPHVLLPGWLQQVLAHPPNERDRLMVCTGARGPWLAALNPDWRPLLERAPLPEHWESGSLDERAQWLTVLRKRDAAESRAALESVWANEPPEVRERLLACLSDNLSLDDEALLERARTDKRKEVRRLALDLLAKLPGSVFSQRLLARATEWLAHIPGGLLRAAKLEVRLPDAYDKAWALDGVPEKTTRQNEKIGDKANWLVEMIGQIPLLTLLQRLQLAPAAWVKLLGDHEYSAALWTGSVISFERQPNTELLPSLKTAPYPHLKTRLMAASLQAAARANELDPWLSPWDKDDFAPLSTIVQLPRLDLAWSQRLLVRLRSQAANQPQGQPFYWGDLLSRFAERIHPQLLSDYLLFLEPLAHLPYVGKTVTAAVEIADLRHKLHQHRP